MEAPFTFIVQTVTNAFCIKYVVMIVVQHTQVTRIASLLSYTQTTQLQIRVISIIHQFHDVLLRIRPHGILWSLFMEKFVARQLIYP
jgi:hypothetical protein